MKTINKAILLGYLGNDPEIRYTTGDEGRTIANFSVATTEKWKVGNETKEDTQWHRCVAWGKQGELVGQLLKRGSKVYLEGRIKTRKWTDKEKIERYTTEVVVDEFSALDDSPRARTDDRPTATGEG